MPEKNKRAVRAASELIEMVENPSVSVVSLLRKAIYLARVAEEEEYRMLFELHLTGHDLSADRAGPGLTGWEAEQRATWPFGEAFIKDRSDREGGITVLSAEELEYALSLAENIGGEKMSAQDQTDLILHKSSLRRTLSNIRNRVASFAQGFDITASNEEVEMTAKRIFIGHGRSAMWRELLDFLERRLGFLCDEFNREPSAGIPTTVRLEKMLQEANFAFLVMTAEDQQPDGSVRARENVIHEAGLFQGRLGFHRAILLLEEGCSEFSNVHGLGQIRFARGNLMAKSEEIRKVLEREGLLDRAAGK